MNGLVLQGILVVATSVYGLGAARLMFWILDLVLARLPGAALLKNLAVVLGWFVGGGALMLGALQVGDLERALGAKEAYGVALLCYLGGFGTGLLLVEHWNKPSLIRDLRKYMGDDELEAILLILRYNVSPEDAAETLGIPTAQMLEIYKSALKKLNDRGKRLITALSRKNAELPPAE